MGSNYLPSFPDYWEPTELYSLADWINGLAFRKINFDAKGAIPIIKINELKYGITGQTGFTNQSFDKKYLLKKGDLLFSWSGSPETSIDVFWFDQEVGWLNQHIFKVIPKNNIEPEFMFYLLKYLSPNFVNIARDKQTTGLGHVTKEDLGNIQVRYPSKQVQKNIVSILKSIDDKIELNRQTNQTLEAIAQAIFKEWFVDFRFPGATGEMQDSELGPIPKGWRVGKLGEVCEFAYGKGLKSESRIDGKYPVVGSNGIVGTHAEYFVDGPGIVIGRKGTIGEVLWIHQNFFPIDTTFYIKDLLGVNGLYFHYFLLKLQDFKKISSDSAVPGLNRNQAYDNTVNIPTKNSINEFNKIVRDMFENIQNNEQQSAALAAIRDALLPKLMNGEIEV